MEEWNRANDVLPPENEPVLGYKNGGYVVCECYGRYYDGTPYWTYTGLGGDPDFWMHLPEPPKDA